MLDRKVVDLTDGLIQSQFAERRKRLAADLLVVAEQCNAKGNFHSSIHLQRVVEICRREIEVRGWIVHNAHTRVLSQLAIEPYPELSQDLKGRLSYFLPLGDDYALAPQELSKRLGLQSHPDTSVHEAHDHVLAKLKTEIDLYVETLTRRKKERDDRAEGRLSTIFMEQWGHFRRDPAQAQR